VISRQLTAFGYQLASAISRATEPTTTTAGDGLWGTHLEAGTLLPTSTARVLKVTLSHWSGCSEKLLNIDSQARGFKARGIVARSAPSTAKLHHVGARLDTSIALRWKWTSIFVRVMKLFRREERRVVRCRLF
jgi:hypothetical protein